MQKTDPINTPRMREQVVALDGLLAELEFAVENFASDPAAHEETIRDHLLKVSRHASLLAHIVERTIPWPPTPTCFVERNNSGAHLVDREGGRWWPENWCETEAELRSAFIRGAGRWHS